MNSDFIKLRLRYYDWVDINPKSRSESKGHYGYVEWHIKPVETALVLVDVWETSYLKDANQRKDKIISSNILPLKNTFNKLNLKVIHAPSKQVAKLYPGWRTGPPNKDITAYDGNWPPRAFIEKTGDYENYKRHSSEKMSMIDEVTGNRRIHHLVEPGKDETIIACGEELHQYCKNNKLKFLFFVGFNTNFCIISRDYGIVQMRRRGYETILIRDCTTGIEAADTYQNLTLTNSIITSLEMSQHYTITSRDLISAFTD